MSSWHGLADATVGAFLASLVARLAVPATRVN